MWDAWKTLFMEIVDKHAPLKTKRISKKHSPWITYDLMWKIQKLNYFKKKAILKIIQLVGDNTDKRGMKLTMLSNQPNEGIFCII